MDDFICKVATREELLKRWEYLINIHPDNNDWVRYKENAVRNFDNGSTISYLGLLNNNMAYLAAFRTNKEYEGKGYFGKLYSFMESDLKQRGYSELSLGVGPEAVRNIEIYFHLGFREYIKTLIEHEPSKADPSKQEEDVILFYKKRC